MQRERDNNLKQLICKLYIYTIEPYIIWGNIEDTHIDGETTNNPYRHMHTKINEAHTKNVCQSIMIRLGIVQFANKWMTIETIASTHINNLFVFFFFSAVLSVSSTLLICVCLSSLNK